MILWNKGFRKGIGLHTAVGETPEVRVWREGQRIATIQPLWSSCAVVNSAFTGDSEKPGTPSCWSGTTQWSWWKVCGELSPLHSCLFCGPQSSFWWWTWGCCLVSRVGSQEEELYTEQRIAETWHSLLATSALTILFRKSFAVWATYPMEGGFWET